ncbi:DUF455-domain-containing protein [Gymnopus androsaceus JB14]|uniref:DUF455-domain-containing protein n=1 Tax=Gymnopus androsaceus JB14 TaxID=1447944 RepID=A0A6A4GSE1_9AGAR|nr:DUF455-domain-containing protein [Gymnopus androsaceus JB14]
MEWAVLILNTPNPTLKVDRTRYAVHAFRTGTITSIGNKVAHPPVPPAQPLRETYMNIIEPGKIQSGKRKNRAVMLCTGEHWTVGNRPRMGYHQLPPPCTPRFPFNAVRLSPRLRLWESASHTSASLLFRLATIHLVHEAPSLNVNPKTIDNFRKAGDKESVDVSEVIYADGVTHVTTGHRWFMWMCEQKQKEQGLVWILSDREKAGICRGFYEDLKGEMPYTDAVDRPRMDMGSVRDALPEVRAEYEFSGNDGHKMGDSGARHFEFAFFIHVDKELPMTIGYEPSGGAGAGVENIYSEIVTGMCGLLSNHDDRRQISCRDISRLGAQFAPISIEMTEPVRCNSHSLLNRISFQPNANQYFLPHPIPPLQQNLPLSSLFLAILPPTTSSGYGGLRDVVVEMGVAALTLALIPQVNLESGD